MINTVKVLVMTWIRSLPLIGLVSTRCYFSAWVVFGHWTSCTPVCFLSSQWKEVRSCYLPLQKCCVCVRKRNVQARVSPLMKHHVTDSENSTMPVFVSWKLSWLEQPEANNPQVYICNSNVREVC